MELYMDAFDVTVIIIIIIPWILLLISKEKRKKLEKQVIDITLALDIAFSKHEELQNKFSSIADNEKNHVTLNDKSQIKSLKHFFWLRYCNSSGEESERNFDLKRANFSKDIILEGFCHKRQSYRCFRLDRVIELVDLETGELIENFELFFNEKYENSPDSQKDLLMQKYSSLIILIIGFARADGRFMKAEKLVALKFIKDACNIDISLYDLTYIINQFETPTDKEFKESISRVKDLNLLNWEKLGIDIIDTQPKRVEKEEKYLKWVEQSV
jgi:hypothetical protein